MSRIDEINDASRCKEIYVSATLAIEKIFRELEAGAPKPVEVRTGDISRFRFKDMVPEAAIFLKLARLVSLIRTLELLLSHARVQEQCIIQRSIEETNEDIVFLSLAVTKGELTEKHGKFLEEFWKEDYSNPADPIGTRIPRGFSRKGIGAYNSRALGQDNPSDTDHASRAIYEMYSGFLHGAAPHIMELYDENTGQFSDGSIASSVRSVDYILDAQNSFYRSLLSCQMAAKALGNSAALALSEAETSRFIVAIGVDKIMVKG